MVEFAVSLLGDMAFSQGSAALCALAFSSRAFANHWLRVCGKATGWLSSPPPLEVSWRSPEWALLLVSALWHPLHVLSPILVCEYVDEGPVG